MIYTVNLFVVVIFLFLFYSQFYFDANAQMLYNDSLEAIVNQINKLSDTPQIQVNNAPTESSINIETNMIYIVNYGSNTVSVISGENNTKIKDIPVAKNPDDIVIMRPTNTIYVTSFLSGLISVISGENNTKIKDIQIGNKYYIMDIAYNQLENTIYVLLRNDTVSVISGENNTKIKNISVDNATDISFNQIYNSIYVTSTSGLISVISGENNTKIKDIPIGGKLELVNVNPDTGTVYVASSELVTVISGANNTKIKDIPVNISVAGHPMDIVIDRASENVYIPYYSNDLSNHNDTILVISGANNTKIKDISLDRDIIDIGVNPVTNTIYTISSYDSILSVISGANNTKIKDIRVGDTPKSISINPNTNTIYITNQGSSGVSVIDGISNNAVAGVTFNINPLNSGHIVCEDNLDVPLNHYLYIWSGSPCSVQPNKDFEFNSWVKNLNGNSTRIIKISKENANYFKPVLDLFNIKIADPSATLNVTEFGTFTANLKHLPPPIPSEYLIGLYSIVATTIIGWSIPSIIGWLRSKSYIRKLNYFHKKITSLYDDGKLDEQDIEPLDTLRKNISDAYTKGKLNSEHYTNLNIEISVLFQEVFKKRINSLDNLLLSKEKVIESLNKIKEDISDTYSKGKITDLHFNLLKEKISKYEKENNIS